MAGLLRFLVLQLAVLLLMIGGPELYILLTMPAVAAILLFASAKAASERYRPRIPRAVRVEYPHRRF